MPRPSGRMHYDRQGCPDERWHRSCNLEPNSDRPARVMPSKKSLSHFNVRGQAHMVDVAAKPETHRRARAAGSISMQPATLALIRSGSARKGDVLGIARIAAIQAAKNTATMIPLAHPLALTHVDAEFALCDQPASVALTVTVETLGRTGVEMEALAATAVGLLTVYDMVKAVDRAMVIREVRLLEKQGGKSGHFVHPSAATAETNSARSRTRPRARRGRR